ncbi:MAG: polyprenol monophosphomannose synthase [Acidimicrobiia bacterium]
MPSSDPTAGVPSRPVPPERPLVVLPTFQEAENIADVLGRIRAALPAAMVVVVDDGSPDGTADLAVAAAAELGQVEVLRRPGKAGLGSAYRYGFAWGLAHGFDALIEMDADLSHDPAMLPTLLAPLGAGYDLAIGSRYVPGGSTPKWKWYRLLLSKGGNRYAGVMLGLGVRDATAGFRAYRADLLGGLDLSSIRAEGYGFQIEMTYEARRAGAQIIEVPISFRDRVRGTSKMSGRIVVEALALVTWWGVRDRVLRRQRRPSPQPLKPADCR